jgi:hypothetical protein
MSKAVNFFLFLGTLLTLTINGFCQQNKLEVDSTIRSSYVLELKLIGQWEIDSLVFINNGVRGNASPPIFPTFWEIKDNGTIVITGGNNFTAEYTTLTAESISLNLMGSELIYNIKLISDKKLIMENIIMASETLDMRSLTFLHRK